MNLLKPIIAAVGISFITSCSAVKTSDNATVVKDCTGAYLSIENKDYLVCNTDILKDYKTGSKVTATFNKVKKCPEQENKVVCMMYHPHEGMININSLK